jgi:hypothetical protein
MTNTLCEGRMSLANLVRVDFLRPPRVAIGMHTFSSTTAETGEASSRSLYVCVAID